MHGIRDILIDGNLGFMFVVCAEMSVFNRVDAYVANLKMPWEEK